MTEFDVYWLDNKEPPKMNTEAKVCWYLLGFVSAAALFVFLGLAIP